MKNATDCQNGRSVEQMDLLFDPVFMVDQTNYQVKERNEVADALRRINLRASYLALFSSLWHTGTPCFDMPGSNTDNDDNRSFLRYCQWNGLEIPCSDIFSSFPTDQGMCCAFNMKAAEDIFIGETYSMIIQNLQELHKSTFFNQDKASYKNGKLRTEPGKNKGLTIILDGHSDIVSASSVTSDTNGYIGLISKSGSFSQTLLGSFDIRPGHNNLVAISAKIINSDSSLMTMDSVSRNCYFEWENSFLKIHKNYTQSNCVFECNLFYALDMIKVKYNSSSGCIPWYFPSPDESPIICDPWQAAEMLKIMSDAPDKKCQHCLPNCVTTIFKTRVTAVPFRNCSMINIGNNTFCNIYNPSKLKLNMLSDLFSSNLIQRFHILPYYFKRSFATNYRKFGSSYVNGDVFESANYPYNAFNKDIAKVQVYFDSATQEKIQRSSRMNWTDFFSNIGGIYGLFLGMGLISLAEIVWVIFRILFVLEEN